jgi:hypothetical protein
MLIQGSRNTGYGVLKILRRFPIKQRVFWQCDQGKGHERYATLKQVANKGECLTCYRDKHKGESLAHKRFSALHPEFVSVLGYETFEMEDVPAGSNTLVINWQCQKSAHHKWRTVACRRTTGRGMGCPFCAHKRTAREESLLRQHREIALEWDFDSNIDPKNNRVLTPDQIVPSSKRMCDWVCPKLHKYKATCKARVELGKECPTCQMLQNCLAKTHPEIARDWDQEANPSHLTAKNLTAGSKRKIFWKCRLKESHKWQATIFDRTKKGYGCPHCSGKTRIKENTLYGRYSDQLYHHYHRKKNPQPFSKTRAGMTRKHWWICKSCSTPYQRTVQWMLHPEHGPGCKPCRKKLRGSDNAAVLWAGTTPMSL